MSSHGYLSSKTDKNVLEQHVPEIDPTANALRTGDSATATVLADAVTENNDGTSIDVHHLQVPEIYAVSSTFFFLYGEAAMCVGLVSLFILTSVFQRS